MSAKRLFTATAIIGQSGRGKTSLLKTFADYLWEVHRRVLLLYSWDGGAIPTLVQKGVRQGIIRFWRARTRSAEGLGLETLYLASKGYWPAEINPETGETPPAVRLVAPLTVKYQTTCAKGHPLQTVPSPTLIQPVLCGTCKGLIGRDQQQVTEHVTRTKGFDLVGGVAFDGLTSMSSDVLDHMDQQRGAGQIMGEKSAFGGIVTSGSIKFGGNNRADVGFGQTRAAQFVKNSLSIPNLVEGPVFTALSADGSEEGLPVIGLDLPGQKVVASSIQWFGNVMEVGQITDDAGKRHFALYLRPFTDAQGRSHLLKTSASPTGVPEILIDPALGEGTPWSVVNLGNVFRMLDEDVASATLEELTDGPGAVPTTYGEAVVVDRGGDTARATAQAPAHVAPAAGGGLASAPGLTPAPGTPAPVPARPATPTAPAAPPTARPRVRATPTPPTTTAPEPVPAPAPAPAPVPVPVSAGPVPQTAPPPGMRPPAKLPS